MTSLPLAIRVPGRARAHGVSEAPPKPLSALLPLVPLPLPARPPAPLPARAPAPPLALLVPPAALRPPVIALLPAPPARPALAPPAPAAGVAGGFPPADTHAPSRHSSALSQSDF